VTEPRPQPIATAAYRRLLDAFEEPIFAATLDVDWASDACIVDAVEMLNRFGVTPTLFSTHASAAVQDLEAAGRAEVGIHPNFLPGSSHGETTGAVLDHMAALHPEPVALRCHSYAENSAIMAECYARGLRLDSNLCLFLQPYILPVRHWTGMWRLPVFWEDDVHWRLGEDWDFALFADTFFSPGLKIVDIHPFVQALNIPNSAFYDREKRRTTSLGREDMLALRHPGPGARTFVEALMEAILSRGARCVRLSSLLPKILAALDGEEGHAAQ